MITRYGADLRHPASAPVMVGVDGPAAADSALTWAADLAVRNGRELRIVHRLDPRGMRRLFDRYDVRQTPALGTARTQGAVLVENVARLHRGATAYAVVLDATRAGGLLSRLDSIAVAVSSHCEGPVVVVRTDPDTEHRDGPVVVGVDGGPAGAAALGAAFEEASERGAALVAVRVRNDVDAGRYAGDSYLSFPVPDLEVTQDTVVAQRLAEWQEKYPEVLVTYRVHPSDVAGTLLEWSKRAQLMVAGSRGCDGSRSLLLGSNSNALVQRAACPVMAVYPACDVRS
jgi:nucleotide-binding universal stress UspA family protein